MSHVTHFFMLLDSTTVGWRWVRPGWPPFARAHNHPTQVWILRSSTYFLYTDGQRRFPKRLALVGEFGPDAWRGKALLGWRLALALESGSEYCKMWVVPSVTPLFALFQRIWISWNGGQLIAWSWFWARRDTRRERRPWLWKFFVRISYCVPPIVPGPSVVLQHL